MARSRFDNALFIQQGACNPSGIARALADACAECIAEGAPQRLDPAVRLITHQLAFILDVGELDNLDAYNKAMGECRAVAAREKAGG